MMKSLSQLVVGDIVRDDVLAVITQVTDHGIEYGITVKDVNGYVYSHYLPSDDRKIQTFPHITPEIWAAYVAA